MPARVLVIEDNPTNLSLMAYLLVAYGHQVVTATDGDEGVETARRDPPDVIVMDLHMPRMNGYDAAAAIRRTPALRHVPIVAVTAYAMVGDRERILAEGFDGYLQKPISPEAFVGQIDAFLPAHLRAGHAPSTVAPEPRP